MHTFKDFRRTNSLVLRSFRKNMVQNLIMLLVLCIVACPITFQSYSDARRRFIDQQEDIMNVSVGAVNDSLVSLEMLVNNVFDNSQVRTFSVKRDVQPQDHILIRNIYESLSSLCINSPLLADLFIVFENSDTVLSTAGAFATLAGRTGTDRFLSYYAIDGEFAALLRDPSRHPAGYYTNFPPLLPPNYGFPREIAFVYHVNLFNLTNVHAFMLVSQSALEDSMCSVSGALTLYNAAGDPIASVFDDSGSEQEDLALRSKYFSRLHAALSVNASSLAVYLAPTLTTIACFAAALIALSLLLAFASAYRTCQPVRHAVEKMHSYGFECKDAQETYQFFLSCIESIQMKENRSDMLNASLKQNLDQSIIESCLRSPRSVLNDDLPTLEYFPQQYVVAYALVCTGNPDAVSEDAETCIQQLQSMLSSRLAHELNAIFITMSRSSSVLIIPADSDHDQQLDRLERLIASSNALSPFSISVAVSSVHIGLSQLNAAYESAHSSMSEFANDPGVHHVVPSETPNALKLRGNEDALLYDAILSADTVKTREILTQIMSGSDSLISLKQCYYYARMPLLLAMHTLGCESAPLSTDYSSSLSPADLFNKLDGVCTTLCEQARQQPTASQGAAHSNMIRLSEKIREYINAHFAEDDLSAQSVRDACETNEKNINAACRMATGLNVSAYIQQLRLEKAASMLRNSDIKVNDILVSCGYNTPNAFFKAFKRVYGQSPSEYRASFRE